MGNALSASGDGNPSELPVHTVYVSAFYMDRYEVTKTLWDDVRAWGLGNGYTDLPVGGGKAASHPVQGIRWYAMVKWCNARSERDGLVPVYYTNDAQTVIYKTGNVNVTNAQGGQALADRSGMGEGGARGCGRASFSVGECGDDHARAGELQQLDELQLRREPDAGLSPDVCGEWKALHESRGIVCAEWLRAVRHSGECVGVVLGRV